MRKLDYQTPEPPSSSTTGGRDPGVLWFVIAGSCAVIALAALFATNGRINRWGDILFWLGFTVFGVLTFLTGVRRLMRKD